MTNNTEDNIKKEIAKAISTKADSLILHGGYKANQLPETILEIPGLKHLCLKDFYIDMPAWLADLVSLESLEIEEAKSVNELLPLLCKLRQLRKLRLDHIGLEELPPSLAKLDCLEELSIDGADFEKFPEVIASLTSLQSFSYKYCDCALPEVFGTLAELPNLKKLRFTHFPDDGGGYLLPESFCRLQALEELYLNQWYGLQKLPDCIGSMDKLRVIDLHNDDHSLGYNGYLKELPDSLGNLVNLEEIDVYGQQDLKQLPPSFARLSKLKRLDTMCSGINELRLTPEQWKNLEELRMHGPLPDLRQCVNLKKFTWFKTAVGINHVKGGVPYGTDEVISMPLSSLRKLESLSIYGGALDSTDFLAALTNLRSLHLYCDFESFPQGFEKLNNLEEINIWGAKSLNFLPEYLGHIPSLKKLYLTGCGVRELPKSVRECQNLYIDVSYCPVNWPK